MLTPEDSDLWIKFSKTVIPLKGKETTILKKERRFFFFKKRTPVLVPTVLDLHGFTVNEAYHLFKRFFMYHVAQGTHKIKVITGKGKDNSGMLKSEFPKWLEREDIKNKIFFESVKSCSDGGAFELTIKQRKKVKC